MEVKTMNRIIVPLGLIGFSFMSELLVNKISFITQSVSYWIFWIGVSVAGYYILLEIVKATNDFLKNVFPKRKAEANKNGK